MKLMHWLAVSLLNQILHNGEIILGRDADENVPKVRWNIALLQFITQIAGRGPQRGFIISGKSEKIRVQLMSVCRLTMRYFVWVNLIGYFSNTEVLFGKNNAPD